MRKGQVTPRTDDNQSQPVVNTKGPEIQKYGERFHVPNGLSDKTCEHSIASLNQVLADTMALRDLYKKHHWQVSGATFYQLHLLFDSHYEEQIELTDKVAERIQALGGMAIAMPHDVAEITQIERPPRGRETASVQLSRLIKAHELILKEAHISAKTAANQGDDGTNDLLVSDIIRTNEKELWFLSEHLVAVNDFASQYRKDFSLLNS
jgi:starvation-inducible DNA-binding protein